MKYEVKKGDSLWNLAQEFLGNGNRYPEIKKASGKTSDVLKIGEVLTIPVDGTVLKNALNQCINDIESLDSFKTLSKLIE